MKRISKRVLIPLTAVLVLLCGVMIFFAVRRDITYRIKTDLKAAFAPSFALQEVETETIQVSLAELQADSRVHFDQSMMLI
ncbi:MAG: hypothetical protein IJD82_10770, partial [Clostridia bacterium]|nr:hypothetical protein [Clostridia bacterium]